MYLWYIWSFVRWLNCSLCFVSCFIYAEFSVYGLGWGCGLLILNCVLCCRFAACFVWLLVLVNSVVYCTYIILDIGCLCFGMVILVIVVLYLLFVVSYLFAFGLKVLLLFCGCWLSVGCLLWWVLVWFGCFEYLFVVWICGY